MCEAYDTSRIFSIIQSVIRTSIDRTAITSICTDRSLYPNMLEHGLGVGNHTAYITNCDPRSVRSAGHNYNITAPDIIHRIICICDKADIGGCFSVIDIYLIQIDIGYGSGLKP